MKLRDYLQKHGITQAAFGRLMHPPVSQGKVNHWLNGARRVSLAEALQIQRVTGGEVAPEDLIATQPALKPTHTAATAKLPAQQGVAHG